MDKCLTIRDVTTIGRAPIDELRSIAADLNLADADSCTIFGRRVAAVETVLKQTYKFAALMVRCSETPEQEAEIWMVMSEFSGFVITALQQLKDTSPHCGTPELYDLALDYNLAAQKRHSLTAESLQCQTSQMPDGLFPQTI